MTPSLLIFVDITGVHRWWWKRMKLELSANTVTFISCRGRVNVKYDSYGVPQFNLRPIVFHSIVKWHPTTWYHQNHIICWQYNSHLFWKKNWEIVNYFSLKNLKFKQTKKIHTSTADESHSVGWKLRFHPLSSWSFCSSDVYRHESGRCRSLPFILKYFYHFTFPGFPFILINIIH